MIKRFIFIVATLLCSLPTMAQPGVKADSLDTERRSQQNVLLNASADSQPRVISLGIPQWGQAIMEDGLPTAMFTDFFPGFWSWRSGLGTESLALTRLDESALQLGNTGFYPMSTSKMEVSTLEGAVELSMSHFGRLQADVNLATPLGNGWSLDLNVFQDLNRGPNHLDLAYLQEHIQYYKAGISKRLAGDRGRFFATYLYTKKFSVSDPYGPFIFVGDGSVKPYGDFVLGRDQYLPSTATFDYVDVVSGEKKTRRFVEDGGIPTHVLTSGLFYRMESGTELALTSRLRLSRCDLTEAMLGGIEDAGGHYTLPDGSPFLGAVQTRYMLYHQDICNEWFTTAELKGHGSKFRWSLGANAWFNWTDDHIATTNFAYEAVKDPCHLRYDGSLYYVPNTGAQYVEGSQSKLAVYEQGQWTVTPRFTLRTGLRLEYSGIRGEGAHNLDGAVNNTRSEGWNLTVPGVSRTPVRVDNLNGAATLVALYRLNDRWGLEMHAIATQQHAELWQYGEADLPTDKPKRNYLVRGGVNYKNAWLDFQSLLMFYQQDNNYYTALWTHELTKAAGGYPAGYNESLYIGSLYSMRVLAWTTDAILTPFKGFSFHGLLTLRSPKYIDYTFRPTFSDGVSEEYDFSGKNITGSPAVELELEPSYEAGRWRFWASARFYGRQYVNLTNSLYFNSHWETFAGIDFSLSEKIRLSANVVNFLNQTGASAGIQAASLATDPAPFKNYLTAGTYLRPFTLEFAIRLTI